MIVNISVEMGNHWAKNKERGYRGYPSSLLERGFICLSLGVIIIPILHSKSLKEPQILLEMNYRPALEGNCIEFPAGMSLNRFVILN